MGFTYFNNGVTDVIITSITVDDKLNTGTRVIMRGQILKQVGLINHKITNTMVKGRAIVLECALPTQDLASFPYSEGILNRHIIAQPEFLLFDVVR